MIHAMKEIGKFLSAQNQQQNPLDTLVEDASDQGRYPHLIMIRYEKTGGSWQYHDVQYKPLTSGMKLKILYKRGASNGPDLTPTCKITDLKKTFPNKYVSWFKTYHTHDAFDEESRQMIRELYDATKNQEETIFQDIQTNLDEIQDGKGTVITPVFVKNDSSQKYLGDLSFFQDFLLDTTLKKFRYSKAAKTYSFEKNKVCAICGEKAPEVFGFFTDLKFYNLDKPGMVTGGFDHKNAWKNYPVCKSCAFDVRTGFTYICDQLDFRFYGHRYYFIPKINNPARYEEILTALETYKEQSFKEKDVHRITNDEHDLFNHVKDFRDNLTFDLLFYERPQKDVLRILLLIEDVLPSRISTLIKKKTWVDSLDVFKNWTGKDGMPLITFNFGIVRNFFPNTPKEGNYDKAFLEITQKIFHGRRLDKQLILNRIMNKIRSEFIGTDHTTNTQNPEKFDVLKGFMLLLYLTALNLFDKQSEVSMTDEIMNFPEIQTKEEFPKKLDAFFHQFGNFFPDPARKATFLLGVLTRFLLNIQSREKGGATPFRSKLKGLKMNAYDLIGLFPEIIEKLEQYKKNYYGPLETYISKTLLEAGHYSGWRIPLDELNFLFVLGMNLSSNFKIQSITEEDNDE
ncbi:MAG: TIGR02556 family CRISPR-associated protein [Fidelibacterota bacterium]